MHSVLAFLFLAFLFLATLNAGAQDSEAGITKLNDSQRLLRIESGRPLDSAAFLLAEDYHLHVNAEDPPFACPDDVIDPKPSQHFALAADHAYLPKGGAFEVRYSVDAQRKPVDVGELLRQIVLTYNHRFSFQYRLQIDDDVFSFVPVHGRNRGCQSIPLTALLDQKISIAKADRATGENLRLFEQTLGRSSGEPVFLNTQAWMNHAIPMHFTLEARNESARAVLLRIIHMTHYRFYWLVRNQPLHAGWVINLQPLTQGMVGDPAGGGYRSPWVLWPGAQPLPPVPPPN
jgi:hypothetical protein